MVVASLLLLAPTLLSRKSSVLDGNREQNINIARERMQELKGEREAGTLSETTYQQTLEELEKSLLIDVANTESTEDRTLKTSARSGRVTLIALLVIVPLLSFGLYSLLGSPQHLKVAGPGQHPATPQAPSSGRAGKPPSMEVMIADLEKKTAKNPNDPDGWYLLGRLYASQGQFSDSVRAYEQLVEVSDRQPTALVVLADSLAMTQGGKLTGRPLKLLTEALEKEPAHTTALWMSGQAAADQKKYTEAIDYWQRAAVGLKDNAQMLSEINSMIAEAIVLAKQAGMEVGEFKQAVATAAVSIPLLITLDPALFSRLDKNDVLFIFARPASGPQMPLAAIKRQASDLPLEIVLDDSALLRPGTSLLDYKQLKIAARISRSGQPVAQSGDLQSQAQLVNPASNAEIILNIDTLVP
jgi:cytochrome c-type biogenesis protein CcmH